MTFLERASRHFCIINQRDPDAPCKEASGPVKQKPLNWQAASIQIAGTLAIHRAIALAEADVQREQIGGVSAAVVGDS